LIAGNSSIAEYHLKGFVDGQTMTLLFLELANIVSVDADETWFDGSLTGNSVIKGVFFTVQSNNCRTF